MEIKGMIPVAVADAIPTDNGTYLFIDSQGFLPAVYVRSDELEFYLAVGYDYWLRPEAIFDILIPINEKIKVELTENSNEKTS